MNIKTVPVLIQLPDDATKYEIRYAIGVVQRGMILGVHEERLKVHPFGPGELLALATQMSNAGVFEIVETDDDGNEQRRPLIAPNTVVEVNPDALNQTLAKPH